jgi:hyperosmotically inducible periplasmic protein
MACESGESRRFQLARAQLDGFSQNALFREGRAVKGKTMKVQATGLCLALGLGLSTLAAGSLFTGCVAGDRYSRSTGEYIDDQATVSRVKSALNDNAVYKFTGVKVASFKGTVQLSGFVDTAAQATDAVEIAGKVPGAKNVVNSLTVKSAAGSPTEPVADDKALTERVVKNLGGNPDYKFGEVNVAADNGTVQLSGFVNTAEQQTKAGEIAKQVQGVKDVVNNITVKDKL